jgi:hypothetical protein
MTQRTKKQHIVPRFYLSKFCDSRGSVWTYTAKTKPIAGKPKATAVETNFYTPVGDEGERFDEVESFLSEIESAVAPLWDSLSTGKMQSGEKRERIALFLAAQYLRSPAVVGASAEMMAHMVHHTTQVLTAYKEHFDRSMGDFEDESGERSSPEERGKMRQFLRNPDNYQVDVLRSAGLPVLGSIGAIAQLFVNVKWVVGRSKDQHLITSDSPVTRLSSPDSYHPIYGDGAFANKTVRVHFPLSPDRMLELTWQGEERERVVEIPKNQAREMNRVRAVQSERFLYGNQRDRGIQKLCEKWLGKEKAPKIAYSGGSAHPFRQHAPTCTGVCARC